MWHYLFRRLLVMSVTLFGITIVTFVVINLAPGSPVEQRLQAIRFGGGMGGGGPNQNGGVSQQVIDALNKQYGFDKPLQERYIIWLKNLIHFDFGESFTYQVPVTEVITGKFPVSLQFGLISFFLTYLVCIPLGIRKAVHSGSVFDMFSSFILFVLYSVPPVMLAILLITFLAGGSFLNMFPIGSLASDSYDSLSFFGKIADRAHHFILPLICYMIGNFTVLTILMKNSLLDEIRHDYVRTARAKGLNERIVIYKHALRNALIPIATGLSGFLAVFFSGSIIIEQIFNLDGMGLLGYSAVLQRDYNVLMGLIFIESFVLLLGRLLSDLTYVFVDPRIDFS